jgi:hypothetical protein
MSLGSLTWGTVASHLSIETTLLIAALALMLGAILTFGFKLNLASDKDLEPSIHWPTPVVNESISKQTSAKDASPVLVTIEYIIQESDWEEFILTINLLGDARASYGAYQWGVMQDTETPSKFIEYFFETSWLHHLHHHERISGDDKVLQTKVNSFQQDKQSPVVRHYIGAKTNLI